MFWRYDCDEEMPMCCVDENKVALPDLHDDAVGGAGIRMVGAVWWTRWSHQEDRVGVCIVLQILAGLEVNSTQHFSMSETPGNDCTRQLQRSEAWYDLRPHPLTPKSASLSKNSTGIVSTSISSTSNTFGHKG